MTLLQTRVEDKVAARFKKVASQRGMKPYEFLQHIVADAAELPEPGTWDNHWARIAKLKLKKLNYSPVCRDREESQER
jgi:hypothetical protein